MTAANLKPFQPGQSGNPKGRPMGARSKLGEAFLEAMNTDFQEHGADVIQRVRHEKPDQYLKVVASILPRELNLTKDPLDEMSDEDLDAVIKFVDEQLHPTPVATAQRPLDKREVN